MNKRKISIFGLLLIGLAALTLFVFEPFKIIDPSDPRFDPDKFSFSDYNGRDELIIAYKRLFPRGTPKSFVDRVLVKAGKASCYQNKNIKERWDCRQPKTLKHWDMGPVFSIAYDNSMHLINLSPNNSGQIYSD